MTPKMMFAKIDIREAYRRFGDSIFAGDGESRAATLPVRGDDARCVARRAARPPGEPDPGGSPP